MDTRPTVLCIAGALFGRPFLLKAKEMGWRVFLLTEEKYLTENWPREQIDEIYAVPDLFEEKVVKNAICYLMRTTKIDKIVGLGEFDIEVAAALREFIRYPGMGETTSRYFRDKLAMRMKAREDGIPVPDFSRVLNYDDINKFFESSEGPWLLKPRMSAASARIEKIHKPEELWPQLETLGDKQHSFLIETFLPGDVYHVDSLIHDKKVVYASVSKYGKPMLELTTAGGIFTTRQIKQGSPDEKALQAVNKKVIKSLGLVWGTTHIEYIKSHADGKFYFLEAGARVGGARIPDVIWHATGLCQWHEWAKIELLDEPYKLPKLEPYYGGGIFTLSHLDEPDLSGYNDPEVCWVQKKKNFAGLIVKSKDPDRVEELLESYVPRFANDFMTHKKMEYTN